MPEESLHNEPALGRALGAPARAAIQRTPARRARLVDRRFAVLLTGQVCFGYAFSSFFLLPKYLASELGARPAEIGLLTAVNGGAVVVFMFLMGVLVDRYGRRRFLTGGALLMTAASLGFLVVDEMGPLIYGLRVLQGFAFSMAFVAGAALTVDQASPERLSQSIGLFGLSMLAMNAVAPVFVEEIAQHSGWPMAFATAAGGSALCALISLRVHERPHTPDRSAGLASLLRVARRPEQMRAAAVIALVGSCFTGLFVFNQLYALELGITEVRSFFVAYACSAIFARLVLGGLGDRFGRLRVAAVMLVLYAIGTFAMLALARIGLAPLGALFGLAHGIFYPTYNAAVVEGVDEQERGKALAIFQGWFNAGLAAGGLLLGLVADAHGYPAVFVISGAGIVLALIILLDGMRRSAGKTAPG
jgi:MFS family permease